MHLAYNTMVGAGSALLLLALVYGFAMWKRRHWIENRWFLRAVAVSGVLAVAALETGWVTTEVGRQPWIVYGHLRTADAVSPAPGLFLGFYAVVAIYAVLTVFTVYVLRRLAGRHDVPAPYEGGGEAAADDREGGRAMTLAGGPARRHVRRAHRLRPVRRRRLRRRHLGPARRRHRSAVPGSATLIEHSIAPVWEANHVWLIFVLVVLWTAFSTGFAAVVTTLYIPLTLAAFGMIARGAAFAFRKSISSLPMRRFFGACFAASSLATPFFLGTVVGGGRLQPGAAGHRHAATSSPRWLNPTSILGGVLAVLVCAYLAAVFLCLDARREGHDDLADQFRTRALGTAATTGAVGLVGIFVLRADAPLLFDGPDRAGAAGDRACPGWPGWRPSCC